MKKTTCKYLDDFSGICCNGDAKDYVADVCPFENVSDCEHVEETEAEESVDED